MLNLLLAWLINAVCLIAVTHLVPGVTVVNFTAALVAAAVLGLINVVIKPILALLTLPVTILTLGLFSFVLNALMFGLAAYLLSGFTVSGFIPALIGAIVFGILSWIANAILLRDKN